MSEYQYVTFQAVDSPLNDQQLEFAQRQSTRAQVSRWSLSVEYHYSSFRGDVDGLLRQGYDVYLQYADYGVREMKLRLPCGIPVPKSTWKKYVIGGNLHWKRNDKGSGGILTLCPYYEPGGLNEVWETQQYVDAAISLRARLITGDLRALYLLWLCTGGDDNNDPEEMIEPPVPHGIGELANLEGELLTFFGLDPLLLIAAGKDVDPAPVDESQQQVTRWVNALGEQLAKDLLLRLLTSDTASIKANLLARIRQTQARAGWPTSDQQRTFAELLQETSILRAQKNAEQVRKAQMRAKREQARKERLRADRMKEMLKDPDKWLHESERLVAARGTGNYQAAAEILHDLRDAIGGDEGDRMTRRQAVKLAKKYPTLNRLKSSLRKLGLLE